VNNPKKFVYYKVYKRTSFDILKTVNKMLYGGAEKGDEHFLYLQYDGIN